MMRLRLSRVAGSGTGTADNRDWVYGCVGCSYRLVRSLSSTMRPRYITATRFEIWRTTDKSCAMNR